MDKIIVKGGNRLKGVVEIEGAKNAVLPILAAGILASEGQLKLSNVPILSDVYTMNNVLRFLNVDVEFDEEQHQILMDATNKISTEAPFEYVSKMRASVVVMGPLLARTGHAKVAMPGGCAIGSRPIDLHLKGLTALGAHITQHDGYIEASARKLIGTNIYLDFPSVGATQNIMMAATLAQGTSVIENAACEPEIVDLAMILNKMGAHVTGAGTETIRIVGVRHLHGTDHAVVQDRIEAGTFMVAAAATQGNVLIKDAISEHNKPLISKMREMGVQVIENDEGIRVVGPKRLQPVSIKTLPHPGFPTDMQPQISVLQLLAHGTSTLTETVFENRFMHLEELRRMNAQYKIEGSSVIMNGPTNFSGAEVAATDLRAGAALVIAGLVAKGYTQVTNLKYLDRGYYNFHGKLSALGAQIKRVSDPNTTLTVKN
ncbi:UDP-N-acetylglucosamine 1-carboxyvinyltransferase [Pediococcus ethanolidurans]|uniref:UDP-N-acetylglucosamine 1-carboxyvinyltransferase n=1 Tax=Pediococcus ethanolidurans TaxID=319653 RepID=A0A0R2K5G3_9LACO|nr:UDP-N-acetylglucosamine 1-carboxyvinyltransferase [Pediococcus ethanolidurans]KRN81818.1 udp-n-acetylglucosamine 1-carboxyvinyltransferase 1 [Pediococcus ethanolidurans]MBU7562602.1 UDP-N-acetylglucosamine 1-carboxyvinyltransferase [Pediococcus ethanolidurans]MCT4397972.1 UDP-N-acetylglucosamine 1-carboxyvinyltransferase [Pediococcus ethanolidurans]MCV3314509.1 UDP-N-acetylglucosamine 1-carboxyvinyltransferase [Pediococcus ethanolidurans]MCV3321900.1 UDP-N-acetylglucosamine 1-carboxyvinyltr